MDKIIDTDEIIEKIEEAVLNNDDCLLIIKYVRELCHAFVTNSMTETKKLEREINVLREKIDDIEIRLNVGEFQTKE